MEYLGKSKYKRVKAKKSKRKSAEMGSHMDQEEESALALLQMREAQISDSRVPYYADDHAASAHLMAETPPVRPPTESKRKKKSRKTKLKVGTKKRGRTDNHESPGSEELRNKAPQYPDLPSTPPEQIDCSSPLPYRPSIPSANALDDIPTDDDDVAAYEKYAKDNASADPSNIPNHHMSSLSQQPPIPFGLNDEIQCMHGPCQSPTRKQKKKRKRRTDHKDDNQQYFAHEQGQLVSHFDSEAFDRYPETDPGSANMFHKHEVDTMPIDPELHSMNALLPSADLSTFSIGKLDNSQKNGRDPSEHDASKPRKRRRLEELQGANTADLPYMSPYAFQHDQENVQDQVLPGLEDMQRQTSPELRSPFVDTVADGDAIFSSHGVQAKKGSRRKTKDETKKARRRQEREISQNVDGAEPSTKIKAENGGAFSAVDGLQLDAFRDNYCEANDMPIWQFNNLIQAQMRGNAQVTALFNEIHEILPYRTRISVQKFCRRRFHNFSRGPWKPEEDVMLKQAVAEKGKSWKIVGDSLGRMPEDCRDRWRNYLVNSEHRNREQWTDAEVVNLCTAILESMQLMKEDRISARENGEDVPELGTESDQEFEDMKHINWQSVSDRMGEYGGGRSRLQCSFKWGQLEKREQAKYLKAIKESREIEKKKSTPVKNPWRMKLASKKVANMKSGDIHAFLQAVLDARIPDEGNIPWKSLGDDKFRATWTSTDKKAAWSRLKEQVPGFESMHYLSVANELYSRLMDGRADALEERWDLELHGDVSAGKARKKRTPSKKRSTEKGKEEIDPDNRYLQGSDKFIYDSDDVDGDAEYRPGLDAFEPEGFDPYNALPMAEAMDSRLNASHRAGSRIAESQYDIFNDGRNTNVDLPMVDGDVSPELAGRVHMLNSYA